MTFHYDVEAHTTDGRIEHFCIDHNEGAEGAKQQALKIAKLRFVHGVRLFSVVGNDRMLLFCST